ncbi:MAG: PAS domain S-box protein [Desulfobacteraceae bacterium]
MDLLIKILHLEDDPTDAELIQAKLADAGLKCRLTLVWTRDEFETVLQKGGMDIILADYRLPNFDGMSALEIAQKVSPDLPFIFVSGTLGEEAAIAALTRGATDYVLKQNLSRLAPAVQRALREARNLEDRKQAHDALRHSNDLLRAIIEAAPIAIVGLDLEGCVHSVWNPAAEKMLGWSAEEVMGHPLPTAPIDQQEEFKRFREQIRQGLNLDGVEVRQKRRDGTPIDSAIYASPLHDHQGRVSGNIALLVDITERKQTELQLNEQLLFLQQLIDSIPLPVYYKDAEQLYLGCNAAFSEFMGFSREEIVGKTIHDIAPRERADIHHEVDQALLLNPGIKTYEAGGKYKDGDHHDVIFHKATFFDANHHVAGTVGTLVDITERKKIERERLANLRFFESMDKVHQAIQGAEDMDDMMKDLLDVVLSIFDCDRAFLLYPCDPEASTWTSPMERTKLEYPGVRELKLEIPMDPQFADALRILLEADGPVMFGPETAHEGPEVLSKRFNIKSRMAMAVYPKTGSPWQFGIHQCAHPKVWTAEEMRVFEAIGRRLADRLSSLLSYRDLRQNEAFLDSIVEHIPNMIFVKDARTLKFVRFNKAGEQLVGYSRDELLGKTDHDFFPKQEADFFTTKDRQVLDAKEPVDIPEETIRTRDHEVRLLHTRKIPLLDETGEPQFLLGISEDITERKQAEASLRKLSQVVEQSPASIVITDAAGSIEFVNAKFTEITGYSSLEAVGENPRILKSGKTPPEEYERMWETIKSGGVWQSEFHNRKKNGELFWEQATIAPIRDTDNNISHYVAVKEDITQRKELEEQLRQSQKMEAVGQLAGGVAHDFNNMLGVIIGHAELALGNADLADGLRKNLKEILAAGLRSSDITRQLLAFARKQTIAPKVLDLNETVEGMLKLLRRLIGEDIDLVWMPGAGLWPVKMDPSQIDQILANLCINARDAISGVGRISIETKRVVFDKAYCEIHRGFSPGEYVMLAVSDTGSGMDKVTKEKIFEPFFTTKGMGMGTGLGLATVYGIVKQNQGFINVYSESGEGSTFKIYLLRHATPLRRDKKAIAKPQDLKGDETILLVEDEALNLELFEMMLKTYGYQVIAASSPRDALHEAEGYAGKIHMLLTDIIMPEMNGQDLAEAIASDYPDIMCLYMSGYTDNIIVHQGILDEGVHFIQKPFSMLDLAVKVREVLDAVF